MTDRNKWLSGLQIGSTVIMCIWDGSGVRETIEKIGGHDSKTFLIGQYRFSKLSGKRIGRRTSGYIYEATPSAVEKVQAMQEAIAAKGAV